MRTPVPQPQPKPAACGQCGAPNPLHEVFAPHGGIEQWVCCACHVQQGQPPSRHHAGCQAAWALLARQAPKPVSKLS